MADWLVEESVDPRSVSRSLVLEGVALTRGATPGEHEPTVAVRLHDVLIHNNKKWLDIFGGADVRLDAVVVQGNVIESEPAAAYVPATLRFSNIGDGDSLPSDESGMLLYFGRPRHFLDLSIIVSRDRRDSDDLSSLLAKEMNSSAMTGAMASLLGLAVAAPPAAAVVSGLAAAATIGDLAYKVVRNLAGTTIGMYRGNRLAYPEKFGAGRNPSDGSSYRKGDFSFWYEVVPGAE